MLYQCSHSPVGSRSQCYVLTYQLEVLNVQLNMPDKLVAFIRYKHKTSTWITQDVLTSTRHRD